MNNGFSCSAGSIMKCHSKGHVARTLVSGGTPCPRTWWTFQQAAFRLTRGSFAQLRRVISVTLTISFVSQSLLRGPYGTFYKDL